MVFIYTMLFSQSLNIFSSCKVNKKRFILLTQILVLSLFNEIHPIPVPFGVLSCILYCVGGVR